VWALLEAELLLNVPADKPRVLHPSSPNLFYPARLPAVVAQARSEVLSLVYGRYIPKDKKPDQTSPSHNQVRIAPYTSSI